MARTFTLASRASPLAQIQTNSVLATLHEVYPASENGESTPKFEKRFMTGAAGDTDKTNPLFLLGGKALWTKELEVALIAKEVDLLIHCLKDVPTTLPEGCMIGAIMEREDPVDSLVVKKGKEWKNLDELPEGSVVGTGSVRRVAQIQRKYPHLKVKDVRGNVDTRLAKLDAPDGPYDALILAKAGLVRMGRSDRITSDLSPPTLYYAVSQGALGIEIREDDVEAREICDKIAHRETSWKCSAERSCLKVLEGGCSVPVGVESTLIPGAAGETLRLTGCVTSVDGQQHVEYTVEEVVTSLSDVIALGEKLAHILLDTGAKAILDDINEDRARRATEIKPVEQETQS
ncbi:porphobilinogen deaminase, dipyromethane cofactor binding domain-containing protein [Crepidotus variabilis]|uniref:hydroxymethylbilane synthase n=1 Tax=Crepidotus variabilis TaxID=179855 RepID=A0A9P6EVS6_9AGAR|nr:porphobilinogen deaminase, dipyromethane cofactor binding domain-containing protein [Crepidotus variabilis]